MRTLAVTIATGLAALAVASSAAALPSYSLVWSGTTGTGTTGGAFIDASAGDILTLDVIINIDAAGFTGVGFDLLGTSGLTASANSLIPGAGGPPECPQPPNVVPGSCFSVSFILFSPFSLGVTDIGSSTFDYD